MLSSACRAGGNGRRCSDWRISWWPTGQARHSCLERCLTPWRLKPTAAGPGTPPNWLLPRRPGAGPGPAAARRFRHRPARPHRPGTALAAPGARCGGVLHRGRGPVPRRGRHRVFAIIARNLHERSLLSNPAQVIKTRLPEPPPAPDVLLGHVRTALEELKARETVEIDVRGKTSVCDFMV